MQAERRHFLKTLSAGAVARTLPQPQEGSSSRPNVVIIMTDQHRAGLTRRGGFPLDTMPALDRLASRGVAFDRSYCTAPLCVPSRISLLTGRWPQAHRVRENSAGKHAYFTQDIYDVARSLGYRTGLAGKNHSHLTPAKADFFRPYMHADGWRPKEATKQHEEFDAWMQHLNHGISAEPTPFPVEMQYPYRIVSDAIEFMRSVAGRPFFLWVSFPEPHNPYQVPKPYFNMFPPESVPARTAGPEALAKKSFKWNWLRGLELATYPDYDAHWRRTRSNYLGMLRLIDDQVGRLVQAIDLKNTLVVFTADHGDYFCDYGLIRKGVELPEALARVPMVWAGAGVRPRTAMQEFVSVADIMPTLCEAMGTPIPTGAQGRSLWPLLQGETYAAEEFRSVYAEVGFGGLYYEASDNMPFSLAQMPGRPGAIKTFDELNPVTQSGMLRMVRMGDWKLCFDMMGAGQMYDLHADPYELNNLFGDPKHAPRQIQLLEELLAWAIRTQDNLPTARYQAKWPKRNWYAPYRR